VKTAEQHAAEEIAKQNSEYMASIKAQPSFEERMKAEKTMKEAEQWAKGQEAARAELAKAIMDYQCYGLDHVNIIGSEMVQAVLKQIRVPARDGKGVDGKNTDYIATVQWVRATISELPDHPRQGDTEAAVQRVRANFAAAQESKKFGKNNAW
jgi:peptidoglycan/xylan/chitin deacetylase (PgdA/CDA1 family)